MYNPTWIKYAPWWVRIQFLFVRLMLYCYLDRVNTFATYWMADSEDRWCKCDRCNARRETGLQQPWGEK